MAMFRFLAGAVAGAIVAVALVLVAWPAVEDRVQYRPVWMIRDDYLRGREVGLRDDLRRVPCNDLSEVAYDHGWVGSAPVGEGPAQDQVAFWNGCTDAQRATATASTVSGIVLATN